ncbi:MAG: carbonic anhydrase [Acidimicrobiia bacterium]|nr:carbonic anhydrase [Acidimicrobiia bacterium]
MASDLEHLIARNEQWAEKFDKGDLPIKANLPVAILSCIDPRTSPVHFFGLDVGDALIMRTVGGRVTESVEAELAVLWFLMGRLAGREPVLSLAVIHHTDCGMQKIAGDEARAALTEQLGTDRYSTLYPAPDPEISVRTDVERLRTSPMVPAALTVTGHVYDVHSGVLHTIVGT